jgi:hypothetical protein
MTLYLSHLLEPLFEDVRQGILRNPLLCKQFVPIIRGEAENLPPSLLDLGLSDNAILQKLHYFVINSFPEPRISAKKHIPSPYGTVGKYIDRFSIVIHGRIAEALAMEAVQDRSEKSRNMLRFLIIVNIIHELAHILRSVFHESHLWTVNFYRYPYSFELGLDQPGSTIPEAGLMAEQVVFGGIVGVVFEDEIGGERPPFFEIGYDRISYFFLQCGDGRAYRLGEFLPIHSERSRGLDSCSYVTQTLLMWQQRWNQAFQPHSTQKHCPGSQCLDHPKNVRVHGSTPRTCHVERAPPQPAI